MADFMIKGAAQSVLVDWHTGVGRVDVASDALIDNSRCCAYFDELGVGCDRIEVYHAGLLAIEFKRNPVLGWFADHKGQC